MNRPLCLSFLKLYLLKLLVQVKLRHKTTDCPANSSWNSRLSDRRVSDLCCHCVHGGSLHHYLPLQLMSHLCCHYIWYQVDFKLLKYDSTERKYFCLCPLDLDIIVILGKVTE